MAGVLEVSFCGFLGNLKKMQTNLTEKLIKFSLLISPIAYHIGHTISAFDIVVFHILSSLIIFSHLLESTYISSKAKFQENAKKFIIVCLAGIALSGFQIISVLSFVNLILALGVAVVVSKTINEIGPKYIIIPLMVNLAVLIGQSAGFSPIVENSHGEPGGILGNGPRFAMYLGLICPIVFKQSKFFTLTLLAFVGIAMKEVYLLLFAYLLLCWEIFNARFYTEGTINRILGCVSLIFVFAFPVIFLWMGYGHIISSLKLRWLVWEPTIAQIANRPIFGYGLGIFPQVSNQFIAGKPQLPYYYHADNAFSSLIQLWFATGTAGVIYLYKTLYNSIERVGLSPYKRSVIFLCLMSLTEYPFQVTKLWLTISIIFGVSLGRRKCS